MQIHIRVCKDNRNIMSIEEAIKRGSVLATKNELLPCDETISFDLSTLLRDDNGTEIFENDIVCDSEGRTFRVIYRDGAFWVDPIDQEVTQTALPLVILQSNGYAPVIVQPT